MLFDAPLELDPASVDAVTVKVYVTPMDNPETAIGEDAPVPVIFPGFDVAVNVIVPVPESDDGVKGTVATAPELVTVPIVGAPGRLGQVFDAIYEAA
jgi:hypothetical protein